MRKQYYPGRRVKRMLIQSFALLQNRMENSAAVLILIGLAAAPGTGAFRPAVYAMERQ